MDKRLTALTRGRVNLFVRAETLLTKPSVPVDRRISRYSTRTHD